MQARGTDKTKSVRPRYTLEFKQEAVRLVTGGQSMAAAARSMGVVDRRSSTESRRIDWEGSRALTARS